MITMNMFEKAQVFAGKVVVITGGSRGIGFAAVKEFLKAGAKVCFLSHYEETGKAALAKLAEINPDWPVIWRCIDLCSEEQAKALFEDNGFTVLEFALTGDVREGRAEEKWCNLVGKR